MKKIIQKINKNPYDEVVEKQKEMLEKNPNTPNLAKLAFYCQCEVDDIVKEICFALEKKNK